MLYFANFAINLLFIEQTAADSHYFLATENYTIENNSVLYINLDDAAKKNFWRPKTDISPTKSESEINLKRVRR